MAWGRALRGLVVCVALLAAGAAAALVKVKPGEVPTLRPDQGLLLASVDSPWALDAVRVGAKDHAFAAATLPAMPVGGGMQLLVVPAGRYRWLRIEPTSAFYYALYKNPEFEFEVRPGRINYPGDLVFRPRTSDTADMHMANRALPALDWLRDQHPKLLAALPFEYVGHFPDPFPERYREALAKGAVPLVDTLAPTPRAGALPLETFELWKRSRFDEVRINPAGDLIAESIVEKGHAKIDLIDLRAGTLVRLLEPPLRVWRMQWLGDRTLLVTVEAARHARYVSAIHIRDGAGKREYDVATVPYEGQVLATLDGDDRHVLFLSYSTQGAPMVHRLDVSSQAAMQASGRGWQQRLNKAVPGAYGWLADRQGNLRVAIARDKETHTLWYGQGDAFVQVMKLDEDALFEPTRLSADGRLIYGLSDKGRGQREAVAFDPATGTIVQTLYSRPGVDVDAILADKAGVPVGVAFQRAGQHVSDYFDAADSRINEKLQAAFPGRSVFVLDRDASGTQFVLGIDGSSQPLQIYHFDRGTRQVSLLDEGYPWLDGTPLAGSQVLHARGSDGLPIEAFLTLPKGRAGKAPLVVLAHGGPVGVADSMHFDPEVQFIASLGYAVLQVNFRGSDGYGRAHRDAGWPGFGTLIEEDIQAAVDVALAQYPLDADRICAMGTSYGGYSSLVSAIRWPQRYRCVVTISGVSDRPLLFTASDLAGSERDRKELVESLGDPNTQMAAMIATSPLYRAADLRAPVMIVHGTEDERVDYEHARRLVRALGQAGRPPVLVKLEGEGHGISTQESVALAYPAIAAFLAQSLGPIAVPPPPAPAPARDAPVRAKGAAPTTKAAPSPTGG